jgi:hypothetical protein
MSTREEARVTRVLAALTAKYGADGAQLWLLLGDAIVQFRGEPVIVQMSAFLSNAAVHYPWMWQLAERFALGIAERMAQRRRVG